MMIALMMEAARTSEELVNFYQTTRLYNPEDSHPPCILIKGGGEMVSSLPILQEPGFL
jgi:hypothetical protein